MKTKDSGSYKKIEKRKRVIMNTQDIIRIGSKARIETEAFINKYINDEAKRWPIICNYSPAHSSYHTIRHVRKSGIRHALLT
jgi:hypothetical protein